MGSQLPRLGAMGIAGIGQMAPAAQNIFSRARGATNGSKRKRSGSKKNGVRASGGKRRKKVRAAPRTRTNGGSRATSRSPNRLKKGSAAAKAYMAKIRKMRK